MLPRRPIFRRNQTFVVVKPIRVTSEETIAKGTEVSVKEGNAVYRLKRWYKRGWIGPKDHAWTEYQLGKQNSKPVEKVEEDVEKKPAKATRKRTPTKRKQTPVQKVDV